MQQLPSLQSLKQELARQNVELSTLERVLGELDPSAGLPIDRAALEAIDALLDTNQTRRAPPKLPPRGMRA
jgi:hypothetical protein